MRVADAMTSSRRVVSFLLCTEYIVTIMGAQLGGRIRKKSQALPIFWLWMMT